MMGFAQGRLELDSEGQALLSELLASLNRATRTVLARSLREGIDRREIREPWALAAGCFPEALTSGQRSLALRKAGDLRKTAQAKELWAGREWLELAKACGKKIVRKSEEIAALRKELAASRRNPLARPEARRKIAGRFAGVLNPFSSPSRRARAAREGVPIRFACPSWTSVMGFAKYGRRNGLNPDQAAALAIARKGLGLKGSKEQAVRRGGEKLTVLNRPERIPRSWLPALPPRSRGKGTEPETPGGRGGRAAPLEDRLSAFLGASRREWGARLKRLDSHSLARATAGFPEGLPPSPDPNGSEGREAPARGPSRPRSAKLDPVKISTD